MSLWLHLSNLADVVTMGFAAAMIAAGLMCRRAWRAAFIWCALIGGAMVLVVVSKMVFIAWGWGICSLDFTGFSGHATRAMAIAPVFLYLLLQRESGEIQLAGVLLGVGFGVAVGISRLALHVHSASEVVSGWMLGGGIGLLFIWSGKNLQDFTLWKTAVAIGVLTSCLLPAPGTGVTQRILVDISLFLSGYKTSLSLQDCE